MMISNAATIDKTIIKGNNQLGFFPPNKLSTKNCLITGSTIPKT